MESGGLGGGGMIEKARGDDGHSPLTTAAASLYCHIVANGQRAAGVGGRLPISLFMIAYGGGPIWLLYG